MLRILASLAIALTLTLAPARRAQATVGIVAAPALIAVGSIVALAGGVAFLDGNFGGPLCKIKSFDGVLSCVFFAMSGLVVAGVGLVILDGDQSLAFSEVDASMEHLASVGQQEIETYNNELDQLNAINSQIAEEIATDSSTDGKARWADLGALLSPATLKIAALNGEALLGSQR